MVNVVYSELKKRNLVFSEKEYSELIWLRQIKVNDKIIKRPNRDFKEIDIKNIKIGILEFTL